MTTSSERPSPPDVRGIIAPLLPSLPGAAIATQPATAILPLLSPILRQRVQLLSSASNEPWVRLLSYDAAKAAKLAEIARGSSFEPHPVSGEVEVDWDRDVATKYRRLDQETLQALVVLESFDMFFRLVYCTGDAEGGGDGWRIGEVSMADRPAPFASFGGKPNIAEAEREFQDSRSGEAATNKSRTTNGAQWGGGGHNAAEDEEDDADDDYWARYNATPDPTPQVKRSPAPSSIRQTNASTYTSHAADEEDAYFAQYDSVQPAMDGHDPDEEAHVKEVLKTPPPPLGLARPVVSSKDSSDRARTVEDAELSETNGVWTLAGGPESAAQDDEDRERLERILHPRPASSQAGSSSGSSMVAKLEESAERREQGEFGVKQHVSRSIKSLFLLSRASGIDRDEFERMVKTELDLLGLMED